MIENQRASQKRKRLRYAMLAVTAGALAAFAILNWGSDGSRFARAKARLQASGEKLLLDQLVSPRPNTTNRMETLAKFKDVRSFGGVIDAMVVVAPGRARVAWKPNRIYDDEGKISAGWWADLHAQLQQQHALLAELRGFLQGVVPRDTGWNYRDYSKMPSPQLIEQRKAAQLLSVVVLSEMRQDLRKEALQNLHALIAMANIHEEDGLLVQQMIRVAIAGLGLAATWELLQAQGWTDAELASLQGEWQKLKMLEGVLFSLEVERALAFEAFEQARTNAAQRQTTFSGGMVTPASGPATAKERIYGSLWKTFLSEADGVAYIEEMQPCIEGARVGIRERDWRAMERLIGPAEPEPSALSAVKETIDEWRFPVTGMMMPNARKALRTVMKQETMRQLAVAALAIARYQLKYERLPESLQQLIPEFLDTMPPDYMDGRPLRYKRNARSDWTLYSVGFNGIDDGGDPIGTTNSIQLWQGRDVVWPRADTKE